MGLQSIRPALEDVLIYESSTSLLRIKASFEKDRLEYLRLFALHMAGDEKIVLEARDSEVFSLVPVQEGQFDFGGDGPITRIDLVKVRMMVYGITNPEVEIKASDIRDAFQYDLGGLTMNSGVLTRARFRFRIQVPGEKLRRVTFEIEPPSRTDLAEKRNSDVIMEYLERQGVKLR